MTTNSLTPNQQSALKRALGNPGLLPFFFRKIEGPIWFDALQAERLLAPHDIPRPEETEASEGRVQVSIPSWPVVEFLVNSSELLKNHESAVYAGKYLNFIREVTDFAKDEGISNHQVWWRFARILKNVPIELLRESDISLIDYWLSDCYDTGLVIREISALVDSLISSESTQSKFSPIQIVAIILKITKQDKLLSSNVLSEAKFRGSNSAIRDLFIKQARNMGRLWGEEFVTLLSLQMQEVERIENFDSYCSVRRPAVEESEQNMRHDVLDVLIQALRDGLLGMLEGNATSVEFVVGLLSHRLVMAQRVAVYVLSEHFETLNPEIADKIIAQDFFDNANSRHELWHFLKRNYSKLGERQKTDVLAAIEHVGHAHKSAETDAYYKAIWYSAIKDFTEDLASEYQRLVDIVGAEPENPDFPYYMRTSWRTVKSPYLASELSQFTPGKLVSTLNNFKVKNAFDGPNIEGLAKEFKAFIRLSLGKLLPVPSQYQALKYPYLYELFSAYQEAWTETNSNQYDWDSVWPSIINFSSDLVRFDDFWDQSSRGAAEGAGFVGNQSWVIGAMASLIEKGCQSKERSFNASLNDKAVLIVASLLEHAEGYFPEARSDAVTAVINGPRGKCIEALINVALHDARNAESFGNKIEWQKKKWPEFQRIFDEELSAKPAKYYDFSTLSLMYLPNFYYLCPEWAERLPATVLSPMDENMWWSALQGFSCLNQFLPELYNYLSGSGNFLRALNYPDIGDKTISRLLDFILIAYVNEKDSIRVESLISIVINRNRPDEIRHIVTFFTNSHEDKNLAEDEWQDKLREKVFELWPRILAVTDLDSYEGRSTASLLCDWSIYVTTLKGESMSLLEAVAPFAEVGHNSFNLIKTIARLSKNEPDCAFEIWKAMLTVPSYPFPEDVIKDALVNLGTARGKSTRYADEIVSLYAAKGYEGPLMWLRDIERQM